SYSRLLESTPASSNGLTDESALIFGSPITEIQETPGKIKLKYERRKGSKLQNLLAAYRLFPVVLKQYSAVMAMDSSKAGSRLSCGKEIVFNFYCKKAAKFVICRQPI